MAKKNRKEEAPEEVPMQDATIADAEGPSNEDVYAEMMNDGLGNIDALISDGEDAPEVETKPVVAKPRLTARGNVREEGTAPPIASRQALPPKARRVLTSGTIREDR